MAKDLTTKIEAMIEIAKVFGVQSTIEEVLGEMQVSSRIDPSQE